MSKEDKMRSMFSEMLNLDVPQKGYPTRRCRIFGHAWPQLIYVRSIEGGNNPNVVVSRCKWCGKPKRRKDFDR